MSAKSALDSINNILAVLAKGDADPATKLNAVQKMLYDLRADVQQLASEKYANYLDAKPQDTDDDFDMADVTERLYQPLKKQEYQNLYAYYDDPARFFDLPDNNTRVAMASALIRISQESEEEPNKLWASIVLAEGYMNEDEQ